MNTTASLSFSKLGCIKGGRQLFKNVDCTLTAGQWLYVAGVNGVGKTSLLRMVCGLAPIESGDILWRGQPIHAQRDAYRRELCYLGHLNALQESMTVDENLAFTSALSGMAPSAAQTQSTLAHFGLRGRGKQLVRHLSQGQKRRVALSRLALSPATLWVLDEPYVAMDESGITMLAQLIENHLAQGGMAVLTSHQRVAIGQVAPLMLELQAQ
ncbi:cytochrome c biogenesis heme-transporting ATPase CcmA [Rhodoferax sp.]|uniref:cytochrome c biogenesis heme-transporting ATPase CcmA n=1 Tax=Rhodoferax sp. TaxID=50421 RepID=UPI0026041C64|nr:cytochrome c biogenesis heme-transporting ATPase CcmA [Rhodoferax sp.]MDD2808585.1 cytochrome c biogenesis heme-transporting ATPase CcmA [Rhodoferax sp.]